MIKIVRKTDKILKFSEKMLEFESLKDLNSNLHYSYENENLTYRGCGSI